MSAELKPCPFCGGVGDLESQPSYSQAANTYNRYRGWCDRCGFGLDWHSDEADAITAWNTRAPATPGALDPATVERCAEIIAMLKSAKSEECVSVFEHSAEEIGVAVMEEYRAVLSALEGAK